MESRGTGSTHRWTTEDLERLTEVVEIELAEMFEEAQHTRTEMLVWNLVPGKLGILVSPSACHQQYCALKRNRDLRLVKPEEAPPKLDLSPLREDLRAQLRSMATLIEQVQNLGKVMVANRESIEHMVRLVEHGNTQAELFGEKLTTQFEALLTELRKG